MQFKIITFGCKLNQTESDQISADLVMAGFEHWSGRRQNVLAPSGKHVQYSSKSGLNFIILNICAVTHKAVREARQKVAQLKRQFPKSKTLVTGCIDERNWAGVDVWVANRDKYKIVSIIRKQFQLAGQTRKTQKHLPAQAGKNIKTQNYNSRTRAFIKIQDGCDNYCSYCIVPLMRGKPKSRGVEEIIKDIQSKEQQGFKEVVLTGVNIGLYNTQYPISNIKKISNIQYPISKPAHKNKFVDLKLTALLRIVLENTNIPRIRLSSLWPAHLTPQLVNLMAKNPRICPHIHLSIQSGSNKILKSMGRNYTVQDITKITNRAKSKISKINFTCDLIVGFPGETDQDFQDTCQLVEKAGFSKVHVFKYSKRPKTKAVSMKDQVSEKVKQARSRDLIRKAEERAKQVKKGFLGQEFDVLWEEKKAGFWYGFTGNYIRVRKRVGKKNLRNEVEKVSLGRYLLAD